MSESPDQNHRDHRVFISHSNKDHAVAAAVCEHLEGHGIGCWIAPRDIEAGDSWASAIIGAIGRCEVMVLVFSEHANASRQVLREIERALQRDRKILTYRVDDAAPGADMEYFLSTEQWLDARQDGGHAHLEDLRRAVARKLDVGFQDAGAPSSDRPLPARSDVDLAAWDRRGGALRRRWPLGLAAAALLALGAWWLWPGGDGRQPERGAPQAVGITDLDRVAVLPFENRSDTEELAWLSTVLAEMVITDLSQASTLHVLSNQELFAAVPEELIMAGSAAAPAQLEELVRRSGAGTVLTGSYAQLGETLQVSLSLLDARSGQILDARRASGAPDEVFEIVDGLSRDLRLALALDDDDTLDRDLRDVTTESLEAYRYYVEGLQLDLRLKREEAIPLLQQAVRIDPTFAMAHARLGWIQQNLGRAGAARQSFEAAFSHRKRLPDRERFLVEGLKHGEAWDSYHQAVDAFEQALTIDPALNSARHQLATLYAKMGLVDEAIAEWETLREAGYDYPGVESGLANMLFARGRSSEAERVMLDAARRQPDNATVRLALGWLYTIAGKVEDAERQFALAREIQPAGSPFLTLAEWRAAIVARDRARAEELSAALRAAGDAYATWQGHMTGAVHAVLRGDPLSGERHLAASTEPWGGDNAFTALSRLRLARLQRESGRLDDAVASAETALAAGRGTWAGWEARFELALAHQARDDTAAARALLEEIAAQAALDPGPVLARFAARLEARLALAAGDPETAVGLLQTAAGTLTENGVQYHFQRQPDHGDLWFELGEALLAADRPAEAAPWLERLVDARMERVVSPIAFVRAYHLLGRARAATGNEPGAREAYATFLDYWGEGVMDGERLREAQAYLDAHAEESLAGQ